MDALHIAHHGIYLETCMVAPIGKRLVSVQNYL